MLRGFGSQLEASMSLLPQKNVFFFSFSRMESCFLQLGPQVVLWNFFLSVFKLVIGA